MKNTSLIFFIIVGICASAWAQDLMVSKPKLILLVNEQNIGGPRNAWWASEVDLSIAETRIATTLQGYGCQIIMPAQIKKEIQEERAFRVVDLTPAQSVKIASLARLNMYFQVRQWRCWRESPSIEHDFLFREYHC